MDNLGYWFGVAGISDWGLWESEIPDDFGVTARSGPQRDDRCSVERLMKTPQDLFRLLEQELPLRTSQGLDVDVSFKVPGNWEVIEHGDGYTVRTHWTPEWSAKVWKIAYELSYQDLTACRWTREGDTSRFEMVSATGDLAFKMVFEATRWRRPEAE